MFLEWVTCHVASYGDVCIDSLLERAHSRMHGLRLCDLLLSRTEAINIAAWRKNIVAFKSRGHQHCSLALFRGCAAESSMLRIRCGLPAVSQQSPSSPPARSAIGLGLGGQVRPPRLLVDCKPHASLYCAMWTGCFCAAFPYTPGCSQRIVKMPVLIATGHFRIHH